MKQKTIAISYRDAGGDKGFQSVKLASDVQVLKPGVFPGAFGHPDLHIVHLRKEVRSLRHHGDVMLFVVCVTESDLSEADRETVLKDAEAFGKRQGLL